MFEEKARWVRQQILEMTYRSKHGHIGGAFSCTDILVVLYCHILKDGDKFILSKGHACEALYAVLADKGYFPQKELEQFCQAGSLLEGHPNTKIRGVMVSTGSLGHGLGIGAGLALTTNSRVFVLMGDGECQEGSVWEAAMFASHYRISNLVGIIDSNGFGATDSLVDSVSLNPLTYKWRAFGWEVREVNGHDYQQLLFALSNHRPSDRPLMVIATTVKGKGVSFMERKKEWHHRIPDAEEYERAKKELRY